MIGNNGIVYLVKSIIILVVMAGISIGQTIQNDVFWKDTDGNPIYSQGGGVLKVGDTYYWYGAKYNGAITYYNDPYSGKNGDVGFISITCYSSKDLANWNYEGDALTASDLPYGGWVGRVGAAYNSNTQKYVLISQLGGELMFATSDTPSGNFNFQHTQSSIENVVNDMSGDQSVFTDDDGQAYLILCNREGRSHQYVAELRPSDYLHVEPATEVNHSRSGGREGNVMFKHNGTYYFCSSDMHGWNASHSYCITSENIFGPYSSEFVIEGTDADFSHVTQTGLAVEVNGTSGSFVIFGGDRWCDFAGNGVGYNQWVPITFDGTKPIFHSLSQWNINASEGTWSVGNENNYVLNPNFEADRVSVTNMAGWDNWTNLSSGDPNGNTEGSHFPGRFALSQWYSADYQASISQNISLPNGTYTLTAWVKSSGGQDSAYIFAKDFGGNEKNYSINQSIGNWTEVSIPDINVTNGAIEVGVYSDANGDNWVNVDDFSLVLADGTRYTVEVTAGPGGTIEQNPAGESLQEGTSVEVTAVPLEGWEFNEWSGDHTGSDPEYTITSLDSDVSLNASFTFTSEDSSLYEGENAKMVNSVIESEHSGFSGSGYADFNNAAGSMLEFPVCVSERGEQDIEIRYANGAEDQRPVSVSVNGEEVLNSLDFTPTGDWAVWDINSITVNLNSGVNTITFTALTSEGGPNIDKIELVDPVSVVTESNSMNQPVFFNDADHTIQLSRQSETVKINMYTINGKSVFSKTIMPVSGQSKFKLPVQEFGNGLYIVKVETRQISRIHMLDFVR